MVNLPFWIEINLSPPVSTLSRASSPPALDRPSPHTHRSGDTRPEDSSDLPGPRAFPGHLTTLLPYKLGGAVGHLGQAGDKVHPAALWAVQFYPIPAHRSPSRGQLHQDQRQQQRDHQKHAIRHILNTSDAWALGPGLRSRPCGRGPRTKRSVRPPGVRSWGSLGPTMPLSVVSLQLRSAIPQLPLSPPRHDRPGATHHHRLTRPIPQSDLLPPAPLPPRAKASIADPSSISHSRCHTIAIETMRITTDDSE